MDLNMNVVAKLNPILNGTFKHKEAGKILSSGSYNFCRNFGWFGNLVYYIDSQKSLIRFDLGQVAAGRIGGLDVVLDGEKIAENLEEFAVDKTKGTVYTLQSNGIVGKIGSSLSKPSSFRVQDP